MYGNVSSFLSSFTLINLVNLYFVRHQRKRAKYHDQYWDFASCKSLIKYFTLSLFFSFSITSGTFLFVKHVISPTSSTTLNTVLEYLMCMVIFLEFLFIIILLVVHALTVQDCRERMKAVYKRRRNNRTKYY